MPTGDTLKKVQPGDPLRIPAGAYNAFVDTARAQRQAGPGVRRGARLSEARAGWIVAYNASGEDAPWGGVVELRAAQLYEHEEFVKPGDADGVGVYGIALAPIASGAWGRVALTGGPWRLYVYGTRGPGDLVGPLSAWAAGDGILWTVSRSVEAGVVEAFFRHQALPASTFTAPSYHIRPDISWAHGAHCRAQRVWSDANTSVETYRGLIRFPAPVVGQTVIILDNYNAAVTFSVGAGYEAEGGAWIKVAPIIEWFTDESSYAVLSSLSVGAEYSWQRMDAELIGPCEVEGRHARSTNYLTQIIYNGASDITMYGLRVSVEHENLASYSGPEGVGASMKTTQVAYSGRQYLVLTKAQMGG